jgi:hypothetical protein
MRLAESLSACDQPLASSTSSPPNQVAARVQREIETVRTRVEKLFADSFHPRNNLPDARAALEILSESNAWGASDSGLAQAAYALWAPLAALLSGRIEFVRASLFDVREEIAAELRAAGPAAERLEMLDRVVHAAMREPVDKLFARILPLMETRFAEELGAAVSLIGSQRQGEPTVEDLARWYCDDGLFARHVRQGRDVVIGVLEFEAERLIALAEACCGAVDG